MFTTASGSVSSNDYNGDKSGERKRREDSGRGQDERSAATQAAYFLTSSSSGPTGESLPAKLHCLKQRTSSGLKAPTTECRTPRLWKRTMSLSSQSVRAC
jgi:hypothetical protein